MGAASVPVGVGPPMVLKIPITSSPEEGEIDLTTVTGLVLTVIVPNGPNGSAGTVLTWAANVAETPVPPYPGPSPTSIVGIYAFGGDEFVIDSVDVTGQYSIKVAMTVPGGSVPPSDGAGVQLEVTPRISL